MATPPLPAGYKIDDLPPLPAGYSLDSGAPAEEKPSTYSKLTASYNPNVEEYAQKHPIFGPVVRFLDAAGGAAMATPEGIYQALSHPSDTAKGALESLKAWRDPSVRAGALSVLPEALGQGVGNYAAGEVTGAAGGAATKAVGKAIPSAETIGTAMRTPEGKLKPIVKVAAKGAGVGVGGTVGGGWGALVGEHLGQGLADAVIPERPGAATAAERRAISVSKSPVPGGYKGPSKVSAPVPEPSPIIEPSTAAAESEGRPATWRNLTVSELASKGGPLSFDAAKQVQLRQLGVPNVGLVADPRAVAAPTLNAPRSVTVFDAQGNPVIPEAPMSEDFGFRVRDIGENGLPIGGNSRAHATTTLEDAQRLAPGRESVQGKPQEIVKYDLSKLKEGKDYVRVPREGQPDWIRMLRPLRENEVQPVEPQ
jgi:hypothetical protein